MPERIPTPPEGYVTLDHGQPVRELPRPQSIRGVHQPIPGVLVWAEGEWKPVVGFRGAYRRTVIVDYLGSKVPGAMGGVDGRGQYMQRLATERIAVRPELVPVWMHSRQRDAEARERGAAIEAERAATKAAAAAERAAREAAREAAMTPEQRLTQVRRELAVGRELAVESRAEVERAQQRLADIEARIERLVAQEAELAAAEGEYR